MLAGISMLFLRSFIRWFTYNHYIGIGLALLGLLYASQQVG